MTLDEWQALLKQQLKAAGFKMSRAKPALGWDVFRRLLAEPVDGDAGAAVVGEVRPHVWYGGHRFELQLLRGAEVSDRGGLVTLNFAIKSHAPLKDVKFVIDQQEEESGPLLSLDEFLERAAAEPQFATVLAHKGKWEAWISRIGGEE
jgi:hypothetical protein